MTKVTARFSRRTALLFRLGKRWATIVDCGPQADGSPQFHVFGLWWTRRGATAHVARCWTWVYGRPNHHGFAARRVCRDDLMMLP